MIKLKLDGQDVWFTSDTHYGHKNIVLGVSEWTNKSGCRFYKTVDKMNEEIVQNINKFVKEDDVLFHLGDWSFGGVTNIAKFRDRLIVKTIHLVAGNHDNHIKTKPELKELFTSIQDYLEVIIDKQLIVMSHFPMCSWNESTRGSWMLHGHSHGTMFSNESKNHWYHSSRILDVGIDAVGIFAPISFEAIFKIMTKRLFNQTDHHDKGTNR